MTKLMPILALVLLIGCAAGRALDLRVDNISGDFILRDVGSGNLIPMVGQVDVGIEATVPVEAVRVPIKVDFSNMVFLGSHNVSITNVSGSIIIESAACRNHVRGLGVDVTELLRRLYLPSNPFWTEEETMIEGVMQFPYELELEELEHE